MGHNTGNELPSKDVLDFEDNVENLDRLMNVEEDYWVDRFNNKKPTIDYALRMVGFTPAGFDFATGGVLKNGDRNKCVFNQADQTWYSWSGDLPYNVIAGSTPGEGWKVQHARTLPYFPNSKNHFTIPLDFKLITDFGVFLSKYRYNGKNITVSILNGTYRENTLDDIFGTEWGHGRVQFTGESTENTIIEYDNRDGIFAGPGEVYGHPPQFPVTGGDIKPIFKNVTMSGISRDTGIDDPYLDAMGIRVFDGGIVVLDSTVKITNFSRVGVMAERGGIAIVPGVNVSNTGSDCFAASEGGYIYSPNAVADNPKGHCFIGYSKGHLYMPNCEAKNAIRHPPGNLGGSGLVLTGNSYAYAINLKTHNNDQKGLSVAMGSTCNSSGLDDYDNGAPVTVSQGSVLISPNSKIIRPDGTLALLVENRAMCTLNVATTDKTNITGRITIQENSTLNAKNSLFTNNIGNTVSVNNSDVNVDNSIFSGTPDVNIFAKTMSRVSAQTVTFNNSKGSSVISENSTINVLGAVLENGGTNGCRATSGGRIYAKDVVVKKVGQYGFEANGLGTFIDCSSAVVGNAFAAFKAIDGGQIYAPGSQPEGVYGDTAYSPAINTQDNKMTIIVK